MMRILLGGSPCTYWSIAQKNNREAKASGIGWELFKNYLIAKEKFKPDYFLYENNVSAAQPIKDEIKKQLGVWDGTFLTPYTDVRYIEINSALVSAQNRQRFYVHNCGEGEQPKDRGILLKDVLESGITWKDKQNTIDANYFKGRNLTNMQNQSGQRFAVAEPIRIPEYGNADKSRPMIAGYSCKGDGEGSLKCECFPDNPNKQKVDYIAEPVIFQLPHGYNDGGMKYSKAPMLTANGCWQENNKVIEPVCLQEQIHDRKAKADRTYDRRYEARIDGKTGTLTPTMRQNAVAEPVIVNYNYVTEFDSDGKPIKAYCYADGKIHTVYKVKDGKITIKGKQYPIKLPDGFYIIRKLTVVECRRLQTIHDWYKMPCSDTQNYKMLGNGWTVEVIKHILLHIPNITKEPIEVLSMYDGMSCGRIALKELGANVVKYYATEIDKYAIQTTQANFPDTIQLGDAFQVRESNWMI